MLLKKVKAYLKRRLIETVKYSYSQCGEDLIVEHIFRSLGIKTVSYLDIGAYHPFFLSNTAKFYLNGGKGVLIEPDPYLLKQIKRKRKRDVCLNIGISPDEAKTEASFYVLTTKTLNTFSYKEAQEYTKTGSQKIEKTMSIPVLSINSVIEKNFTSTPNFLSIDVEGWDLEIIKSLDFEKYRPEVICIETITYSEDAQSSKIPEIIDFVKSKGYLNYADTNINTIFVEKDTWNKRKSKKSQ